MNNEHAFATITPEHVEGIEIQVKARSTEYYLYFHRDGNYDIRDSETGELLADILDMHIEDERKARLTDIVSVFRTLLLNPAYGIAVDGFATGIET